MTQNSAKARLSPSPRNKSQRENHPARVRLASIAAELLLALLPYQDESGLWYQITNRENQPDNWLESSCSCLYAAGLFMAVRLGFLSVERLAPAKKAAAGIMRYVDEDANDLLVRNICVGTGVGDYPFYAARPTSVNDLHGVGSFLLMCTEGAKIL